MEDREGEERERLLLCIYNIMLNKEPLFLVHSCAFFLFLGQQEIERGRGKDGESDSER